MQRQEVRRELHPLGPFVFDVPNGSNGLMNLDPRSNKIDAAWRTPRAAASRGLLRP